LMKSAANLVAMFENDDEEEKGERRQRQNKWKTYVVFWSYNNKKALFICRFFFYLTNGYLFMGFSIGQIILLRDLLFVLPGSQITCTPEFSILPLSLYRKRVWNSKNWGWKNSLLFRMQTQGGAKAGKKTVRYLSSEPYTIWYFRIFSFLRPLFYKVRVLDSELSSLFK
jgi:hypothetical protein